MRVKRNAKPVCAELKTDSPPLSGRLFHSNKQPGVKIKHVAHPRLRLCLERGEAGVTEGRQGRL